MSVNKGCNISLGPSIPAVLLTIVFLLLKVFDKVDWSYWVVFMPLWLPFAVVIAIYIILLILKILVTIYDYYKYYKR